MIEVESKAVPELSIPGPRVSCRIDVDRAFPRPSDFAAPDYAIWLSKEMARFRLQSSTKRQASVWHQNSSKGNQALPLTRP